VKKEKSRFLKFFSLSRHERRKGGQEALDRAKKVDYEKLKATLIDETDQAYTFGSAKDLSEHLDNLRKEFAGQSELVHYHASLIVMIRREVELDETLKLFFALWESECEFLLASMDSRWLVSAADTFADFHDDANERLYGLMASTVSCTVKLYETERHYAGGRISEEQLAGINLQQERVALWDGMSGFAVGTDDTLRNMMWRHERVKAKGDKEYLMQRLFMELFKRMHCDQTVYGRLQQMHTRKRTAWW